MAGVGRRLEAVAGVGRRFAGVGRRLEAVAGVGRRLEALTNTTRDIGHTYTGRNANLCSCEYFQPPLCAVSAKLECHVVAFQAAWVVYVRWLM